MNEKPRSPFLAGLPVAVDVLSAAALLALPALSQRLETPSGTNTIVLGAGFILFAAGVVFLRRLKPLAEPAEWLSPRLRGVLAVFFALAFMTAAAWQLGYFASLGQVNTRDLGEGPTAVYFVFAPGAWLGVSLLYIIFLAFPLTPTVDGPGSGYTAGAMFGLLAAAVMQLLMTAQGRTMIPPDGTLAWGLVAFVVLLALFAPPRIIYAERALGRGRAATVAIGSFVLLCALCAVWIVSG
jgi:hypothetical protein